MLNSSSSQRGRSNALRISALIALSGLTISGFAGCNDSKESQHAVKKASQSFTSVASGDPTATNSFTEKSYKETEQLLSDHAGSDDGYAEGAAVGIALSKLGQASITSLEAVNAETESLQRARVIRGMIHEWYSMSSIAIAAGSFDISDQLNELKAIVELRNDDIVQYQKQRVQIESQITELETQITDLLEKAKNERNQSGAYELEMARTSAAEAAKIVLNVREHTLRADQYQLEAHRIEGVVDQLRPSANEIQLNVEKAKSQVELLMKAQKELKDREAENRKDANDAQRAANDTADRIKDSVYEFTQFRANEVDSSNQSVISLVNGSISSLRDANSVQKKIASLTKSSAHQTLAECYSRQALGHAEAVLLYRALEEAKIPGDWSARAEQAQGAHDEAQSNAHDAFQSAASALRAVRARGDEGEKLEASAVRLDQLGGIEPEIEEAYDDESDDYNEEYDDSESEDLSEEELEEDPDSEG